MKITNKLYYCPVCNNEENHSTNHFGEIYTSCRKCGNSVLYCKENVEKLSNPDKQAKIIFYHFNVEKENEKEAYFNLKTELKNKGYKIFNVITEYKSIQALKSHDQKIISIYDFTQFDNQYVTDIGRVFNWYEAVYPNKRIKEGYYLILDL